MYLCPSAINYANISQKVASKEEFQGSDLYTQLELTIPCILRTLAYVMILCSVYIASLQWHLLSCCCLPAFNLCCIHAFAIVVCCRQHVHKEHGSIKSCSPWALGL